MHEFNELRPYDLIVLQYGLNVATERGRNYDRYRDGMPVSYTHLDVYKRQSQDCVKMNLTISF